MLTTLLQITERANNHMTDEHVSKQTNAPAWPRGGAVRADHPALELTARPGGKIEFVAALVIHAHTSHRYNTEVEKISELKTFWCEHGG